MVTAALLASWVVACDLWVKILARAAGCVESPGSVGARVTAAYETPPFGACADVPLLGDALSMRAASSDTGPFGLVGGAGGSWVGYAMLAVALVVTILVWRWRWRSSGDPLALGALWGGAIVLALPRLFAGARLTELELGSVATGLGDLALLWALAWLGWRAIAEARA